MTNTGATTLNAIENIRTNWGWFLALGIVFIIGGIFAISAPFAAGLAITVVLAIALAVIGIIQIVQAWRIRSWGGFIWQLLMGIIILFGGIAIYFFPVAGTLALTLLVAAVFLAKGIAQIVLAFQLRPNSGWGWMLVAGILAAAVGLIIFFEWPVSAAYALGTLVGISLIFTGWSYVMIAFAARRT